MIKITEGQFQAEGTPGTLINEAAIAVHEICQHLVDKGIEKEFEKALSTIINIVNVTHMSHSGMSKTEAIEVLGLEDELAEEPTTQKEKGNENGN